MNCINNPLWWKAAGIRAFKTFCQTAVATIGAANFMGGVDWAMVGSASALAAVVSLLTSMAGLPEVCDDDLEGGIFDEEEW